MKQDNRETILLFILLAFFALYFGLLYYDSKVLGMPIEKMIELVHSYCEKHLDRSLYLSQSKDGDNLPNKPYIIDFLKNRSLTVRFLMYVFSPSSLDLWIEKQKRIYLPRLSVFWVYVLSKVSNFRNYFQDLFKDKSCYTNCTICGELRETKVSECCHCTANNCACTNCFEQGVRCAFCR
jgi:hypothetical protein